MASRLWWKQRDESRGWCWRWPTMLSLLKWSHASAYRIGGFWPCFTLLWESRTVNQTCSCKEVTSSSSCSPAMESLDSLSLTDFLFCVLLDRERCGKVLSIGLFSEAFTNMVCVSLCFRVLWFRVNFTLIPKRKVGNTTINQSGLKTPSHEKHCDVYFFGVHSGLFMSDIWLSVLRESVVSVLVPLISHLHNVSSPRDESCDFYLACFQVIVKMMDGMVKDWNRETQGVLT